MIRESGVRSQNAALESKLRWGMETGMTFAKWPRDESHSTEGAQFLSVGHRPRNQDQEIQALKGRYKTLDSSSSSVYYFSTTISKIDTHLALCRPFRAWIGAKRHSKRALVPSLDS